MVVGGSAEDVLVGALHPVGPDGGIDSSLDIGAVEVDLGSGWLVIALVDDAQLVPGEGASVEDVVDIEAGVYCSRGKVNGVEEVTGGFIGCERIREDGEGSWWRWEGEVGVVVGGVVALIGAFVDCGCERGVEREDVGPVVDVGDDRDYLTINLNIKVYYSEIKYLVVQEWSHRGWGR